MTTDHADFPARSREGLLHAEVLVLEAAHAELLPRALHHRARRPAAHADSLANEILQKGEGLHKEETCCIVGALAPDIIRSSSF